MHESARKQIVEYLTFFEGHVTWMYLDSIGLVTTGVGILLDPYSKYGKAIKSWYNKTTSQLATEKEIYEEFQMVKSKNGPQGVPVWNKDPSQNFTHYKAFEPITNLRATETDLKNAMLSAIAKKEKDCKDYFKDFDTFPADVQVVLIQMNYAGGLYHRKKDLAPLLEKRDWLGARQYTYLTNSRQGRDGYKKYNAAFQQLMQNAHIVESCSKLPTTNATMLTDIKEFYGFKTALNVARWTSSNDVSTEIRPDDVITGGDISGWLRRL